MARNVGNRYAVKGWIGPPGARRSGRHQKRIRQALLGYGEMTTAQLMQFVFPRVDASEWHPRQRWWLVERAARRYGEPLEPRTRPRRWRLKPDLERG